MLLDLHLPDGSQSSGSGCPVTLPRWCGSTVRLRPGCVAARPRSPTVLHLLTPNRPIRGSIRSLRDSTGAASNVAQRLSIRHPLRGARCLPIRPANGEGIESARRALMSSSECPPGRPGTESPTTYRPEAWSALSGRRCQSMTRRWHLRRRGVLVPGCRPATCPLHSGIPSGATAEPQYRCLGSSSSGVLLFGMARAATRWARP